MFPSVFYFASLILLTSIYAANILAPDAKLKKQQRLDGYLVKEEGYGWKRTYYSADVTLSPQTGKMVEPAVPSALPPPRPPTIQTKPPKPSLFPAVSVIPAQVDPERMKPSPSKTPVSTSSIGSESQFPIMSPKVNQTDVQATKTPIPFKDSNAFESAKAKDYAAEVMAPLVKEASNVYKDLPTDPQEFINLLARMKKQVSDDIGISERDAFVWYLLRKLLRNLIKVGSPAVRLLGENRCFQLKAETITFIYCLPLKLLDKLGVVAPQISQDLPNLGSDQQNGFGFGVFMPKLRDNSDKYTKVHFVNLFAEPCQRTSDPCTSVCCGTQRNHQLYCETMTRCY